MAPELYVGDLLIPWENLMFLPINKDYGTEAKAIQVGFNFKVVDSVTGLSLIGNPASYIVNVYGGVFVVGLTDLDYFLSQMGKTVQAIKGSVRLAFYDKYGSSESFSINGYGGEVFSTTDGYGSKNVYGDERFRTRDPYGKRAVDGSGNFSVLGDEEFDEKDSI